MFVSRFPKSSENGIRTSILVFHFLAAQKNGIPTSIFVFLQLWTRKVQFSFPFFVFFPFIHCKTELEPPFHVFSFPYFANLKNVNTSGLHEKARAKLPERRETLRTGGGFNRGTYLHVEGRKVCGF